MGSTVRSFVRIAVLKRLYWYPGLLLGIFAVISAMLSLSKVGPVPFRYVF